MLMLMVLLLLIYFIGELILTGSNTYTPKGKLNRPAGTGAGAVSYPNSNGYLYKSRVERDATSRGSFLPYHPVQDPPPAKMYVLPACSEATVKDLDELIPIGSPPLPDHDRWTLRFTRGNEVAFVSTVWAQVGTRQLVDAYENIRRLALEGFHITKDELFEVPHPTRMLILRIFDSVGAKVLDWDGDEDPNIRVARMTDSVESSGTEVVRIPL